MDVLGSIVMRSMGVAPLCSLNWPFVTPPVPPPLPRVTTTLPPVAVAASPALIITVPPVPLFPVLPADSRMEPAVLALPVAPAAISTWPPVAADVPASTDMAPPVNAAVWLEPVIVKSGPAAPLL